MPRDRNTGRRLIKNKVRKTFKVYAVQCIRCVIILGYSKRNYLQKEIYCSKCAKEELTSLNQKKLPRENTNE